MGRAEPILHIRGQERPQGFNRKLGQRNHDRGLNACWLHNNHGSATVGQFGTSCWTAAAQCASLIAPYASGAKPMIKSLMIAIIASLVSRAAFFAVLLLAAALRPGLPSQLVGQASAGEPDQPPPLESTQSPPAAPSSGAASIAKICDALAAAAGENDLPVDFFARLIWQESRFDPTAVSRAGAQGVAQFMPATANSRGLADPFDPIESIAHSAKLLRDLRREFGNLGLAAAAYNAGPGRVRGWLAGRRGLPRETDAYVRLITGQSPERWARGQASPDEMHVANSVPCQQMAALVARSPAPVMKPLDPWGVQLVGSSSDETALAAYRRLQEKYAPMLGGREPRVFHHGLARGSMGWARVHVGADSRASAEKLCAQLRAAGASCTVLRN